MNKLYISLFFIFCASLGVAYLAIPNDEEHITMLVRDHYKGEALEKLESLYKAGDRRASNVKQLIKLRVYQGREEGLEQIVNEYLKTRPNDEVINDFRLWIYELKAQHKEFLAYLESLVDRTKSKKYFARLLGKYRIDGNVDEEIRVSEKYRKDKILLAKDFRRLGSIYADRGRVEKALSAFREMDKKKSSLSKKFVQGRLIMFRLLLENGYGDEAVERSNRWVKNSFGDQLVYGLMKEFDDYGRFDLTMSLGEDAMVFNPEKVFVVVDFLNNKKQFSLARTLLSRWKASTNKLNNKEIEQYIKASVNALDTASVVTFLQSHGIKNLPPSTISVLAEEFVFQKQYSLLNVIRPFMSFDSLSRKPVLAAKLALLDGERELASELISDVTPAILESYKFPIWIEVMTELEGESELFFTLKDYYEQKSLPKQFKKHYAYLARKLGKEKEYKSVAAELGGAFPVRGLH